MKRRLTGAPSPAESAPAAADVDTLVNNFLGAVSVDPVRGSRLYNVSIQSADAAFAAQAADTLVEEYVKQNFERRTEATAKSLQFLADEIKKQQTKVEDSERAMAQYRETNNALSLEDRQNTVVASLNTVNDQYHAGPHRADPEGSGLHPGQNAPVSCAGRVDSCGDQ